MNAAVGRKLEEGNREGNHGARVLETQVLNRCRPVALNRCASLVSCRRSRTSVSV